MAEHVAPVLTVPQVRALLAAITLRTDTLRVQLSDPDRYLPLSSGRERRALAADARSLLLAADALRRSLRTLDPEQAHAWTSPSPRSASSPAALPSA